MQYSVELSKFCPVKFRSVKLMRYHIAIKNILDFTLGMLISQQIIGHIVIP